MRANYRTNATVQFEILTEDQREEISHATLDVLEHTGVEVHNQTALGIQKAQSAWVEGARARIPSYLVRQALATAPSSLKVHSRENDTQKEIVIGPCRVH